MQLLLSGLKVRMLSMSGLLLLIANSMNAEKNAFQPAIKYSTTALSFITANYIE